MSKKKTKQFFTLLNKLRSLEDHFDSRKGKKDQKLFALCLCELHFRAIHTIELIQAISKTGRKMTNKTLDNLLTDLINLKIELFDEVSDWQKELKRPLQKIINSVSDRIK